MSWTFVAIIAVLLLLQPLLKWGLSAFLWLRLWRQTMSTEVSSVVDLSAILPDEMHTLETVTPELRAAGFQAYCTLQTRYQINGQTAVLHRLVFRHPTWHTFVLLAAMPTPGGSRRLFVHLGTFLRSGQSIDTNNAIPLGLSEPKRIAAESHPTLGFTELWQRHCRRLEGIDTAAETVELTPAGLARLLNVTLKHLYRHRMKVGQMSRPERDLYRYTAKGAWRMLAAVQAQQVAVEQTVLDDGVLEQQLDAIPPPKGRAFKTALLLGSALVFALAWGVTWSWEVLPALLLVLLFHEAGHALAMRLAGYRDISVFFLPLLGAAATGRKDQATAGERLFVYLAGPLPGLLLGLLLLLYSGGEGFLWQLAVLAIALNYLNLLPIAPLDGGKIVEVLLFSRFPRARVAFSAISALGLLGLALYQQSILIGLIAGLLLFALPAQLKIAQLTLSALQEISAGLARPLRVVAIAGLLRQPPWSKLSLADKVAIGRASIDDLAVQPPKLLHWALGGGVYVLSLLTPLLAILGYVLVALFGSGLDRQLINSPTAASVQPTTSNAALAALATTPDAAGRWAILMAAARDTDNDDARSLIERALGELADTPGDDPRRVATRIALAQNTEGEVATAEWLSLEELTRNERLRTVSMRADILQALGTQSKLPVESRLEWLREAVALRETLPAATGEFALEAVHAREQLARTAYAIGRAEEAEQLLRRTLSSWPKEVQSLQNRSARLSLAWFLIARHRGAEAEALLADQVTDGEGLAHLAYQRECARGWAKLEQGRSAEAVSIFRSAEDLIRPSWLVRLMARRSSWGQRWRIDTLLDVAVAQQRGNDSGLSETLAELRGMLANDERERRLRRQNDPDSWQEVRWEAHRDIINRL